MVSRRQFGGGRHVGIELRAEEKRKEVNVSTSVQIASVTVMRGFRVDLLCDFASVMQRMRKGRDLQRYRIRNNPVERHTDPLVDRVISMIGFHYLS